MQRPSQVQLACTVPRGQQPLRVAIINRMSNLRMLHWSSQTNSVTPHSDLHLLGSIAPADAGARSATQVAQDVFQQVICLLCCGWIAPHNSGLGCSRQYTLRRHHLPCCRLCCPCNRVLSMSAVPQDVDCAASRTRRRREQLVDARPCGRRGCWLLLRGPCRTVE